ncbi:MAG: hypothetical protein NTV54_04585 [Ignavibacteriales bacterium]|nr:hypothetical protein [Ignavibacteriales bacterium]
MDQWLENLVAHVTSILGTDWTYLTMPRGSYFFKQNWKVQFDGWGHDFPPYHFFINNYTEKSQYIYCIIRFEAQEILEKRQLDRLTIPQLNLIQHNVFQFFFQNGALMNAQRDINVGHNPFCIDVNETRRTLPDGFWTAPPTTLPDELLSNIDAFLRSQLTENFRMLD